MRLAMGDRPRYRLRTPSTGREIILDAEPGETYLDRDTEEPMEIVGELVPAPPSESRLPFAARNLRFCNWCGQMAQKDLNTCPTCDRRMEPLAQGQGQPSP
jgi:hypothetical protein